MTKYRSFEKAPPPRSNEPHPIWRGIGCVIMLIIPVVSFALSVLSVDLAIRRGVQLPSGLTGYPVMPPILFRVPGLVGILNWIQSQYNLYAYLTMSFFFIILLTGVIALIYALMYRVTAPPRYTGFDAPPPNTKVKKYKR